ncbi:MAG: hypothetical protein ACXVNF_11330, partial [Neobacillus sp.]
MNKIDITNIFGEIDFINRYQKLCSRFHDLKISMDGMHKGLYDEIRGELRQRELQSAKIFNIRGVGGDFERNFFN